MPLFATRGVEFINKKEYVVVTLDGPKLECH